jgi:hypothetical protein
VSVRCSKVALFGAGIFFGGAVDHLVLVGMHSVLTPYGVRVGVSGNAGLAVLDIVISIGLLVVHRRAERAAGSRAAG